MLSLARGGWRPARGELLLVAVVDEETGGSLGAEWITRDAPREGALRHAHQRGRGRRVRVRAGGAATASAAPRRACSASRSRTERRRRPRLDAGDGRQRAAEDGAAARAPRRGASPPTGSTERAARRSCAASARTPTTRPGALARLRAADPRLAVMFEPMLGVTLHAHADRGLGEDQRDPEPRRAARRLPRAARARRGRGARGHRGGARREDGYGASSSPSRSSATARPSPRR